MARALFYGPSLKIKRANDLLVQLSQIEAAFFQDNRPELVVETDPQTGNKLVKVRLSVDPPEEIHILTGEIIYHLRSSLDQIAVALGKVSTAKPNVKNIYFPTGDNLKGFIASRKANTKGIDPDLVKIICRLKPYDGRRGNRLLRAIFRLANIDKHLELIAAASSGQIRGISNFIIEGTLYAAGGGSLYKGITIASLKKGRTMRPKNPDAKIQVAGQITFGNVSIYEGEPIIRKLNELVRLMERILQRFISYCETMKRSL